MQIEELNFAWFYIQGDSSALFFIASALPSSLELDTEALAN